MAALEAVADGGRSRGAPRRDVPREQINVTEERAVLHTALRADRSATRQSCVDGHDVVPDVHEVLDRMAAFAAQVRRGFWRGATG